MQVKTLKFNNELREPIQSGEKNSTWRMFDDKDLKLGDHLSLVISETGEKFADAVIVYVKEKKLGAIDVYDCQGHETYKSKEDMLQTYRNYYGNKVTFDTPIKLVRFKTFE